jgi:uncharacterized protein
MRFWDSSALVPLLLEEPTSRRMADLLRQDEDIAMWWGSEVECTGAFCRLLRQGDITRSGLQRGLSALERMQEKTLEIQPTVDLKARAMRLLTTHPLRAADALQLAAALTWCHEQPRKAVFVSLDSRLRTAAAMEGFDLRPYSEEVHELDFMD